jgi:hypothetical protein
VRVQLDVRLAAGAGDFVDLAGGLASPGARRTDHIFAESPRPSGTSDAPLTSAVDPENPHLGRLLCE